MNQDQLLSFVRNIIMFAGGFAVGHGYLTDTQVTMLGGIAASVIPFVWSLYAHTDSAKIRSVTDMPDIKKIITVTHPTNSAVEAAAADPAQTKVSPAL